MLSYVCVALIFVAACTAQPKNSSPAAMSNNICTKKNSYYKVDGSCVSYVECIGYIPETKTCPDGFHYNTAAVWPQYPCGYPMDVPKCVDSETSNSALATADCPHQFGFFKSPHASAENCAEYRQCVAGAAVELTCPVGLVFNPDSSRCDWPDNVPSCNTNLFFGFTCPAGQNGNYKYQGDCYHFYLCRQGTLRLLQCDAGMAFDPVSSRCVKEDYVDCSSGVQQD